MCLNSVVPLHQFAVIKDGSISYRPDAVQEIKAAAKQLGEPHLDMRISSTGSIGSSVEKAREGGSGGQKAAAGKQGSFVAEVAELDRFQALSSINKNFRERSEPLTLGATAFNFNMRKAGELLGRAYQLRRGTLGAEESEESDECHEQDMAGPEGEEEEGWGEEDEDEDEEWASSDEEEDP